MPRYYAVVFRTPRGKLITVRASGNTKNSARGWARRILRDDHKIDPNACVVESITFAPNAEET
jgi:hypothetical protein